MRCQFCGWNNPDSKTVCEKCNKPLNNEGVSVVNYKSTAREASDVASPSQMTDRKPIKGFDPKATLREVKEQDASKCSHCGYEIESGTEFCPSCGNEIKLPQKESVSPMPQSPVFKKTVRPNHHERLQAESLPATFSLTLLDSEGNDAGLLRYSGDEVILNRNNTDKGNMTITSQKQATIQYFDGQWEITDNSEMHSTFVRASRPTVLKNGDLILLGDRVFRFDTDKD